MPGTEPVRPRSPGSPATGPGPRLSAAEEGPRGTDGAPSVWDRPEQDSGILALQAGVIVRDRFPERFPTVHRALFAARHDEGHHLEDRAVLRSVLATAGVDPDAVLAPIDEGTALEQVRREHESVAASHGVGGVPTFLADNQAVFVRLMERPSPGSDPDESIRTIEWTIDLLTRWPALNEFKHTSLAR